MTHFSPGYTSLVRYGLPKTLKTLTIFEDFDENLAASLSTNSCREYLQVDALRIANPDVGAALAGRSLHLEQLSASYVVDANDFFKEACLRSWTWNKLQSLALTSRLLHPSRSEDEVCDLLHDAGVVALQMPRLRNLVVWNGAKGHASAFIYRRTSYCTYITWRGTWDLEIGARVAEVWEKVAFKHSLELRIDKQKIGEAIESHGDAIHYLDLPCQVISPASVWQIRREAAYLKT